MKADCTRKSLTFSLHLAVILLLNARFYHVHTAVSHFNAKLEIGKGSLDTRLRSGTEPCGFDGLQELDADMNENEINFKLQIQSEQSEEEVADLQYFLSDEETHCSGLLAEPSKTRDNGSNNFNQISIQIHDPAAECQGMPFPQASQQQIFSVGLSDVPMRLDPVLKSTGNSMVFLKNQAPLDTCLLSPVQSGLQKPPSPSTPLPVGGPVFSKFSYCR